MKRLPFRFHYVSLIAGLFAVSATGCAVEATATPPVVEGEVVVSPPPPPAAEVEVAPASPGPEYFWVGGYHRWNGRAYVWIRGRYERRPHARAVWRAAHWEPRGRGHVWIEGRWD
jgi:hypothetical protein